MQSIKPVMFVGAALLVSPAIGPMAPIARAAAGDTELVSVTASGRQAAGDSNLRHGGGALSADGRYVAFYSFRASLARGDRNELPDVFLRDRQSQATTLVSEAMAGGSGNGWSGLPSLSDDGRIVCFMSVASDLVPDDRNNAADIFVWNRDTGRTELASVGNVGARADDSSLEAAISSDGRYVAFTSFARNLAGRPDPDFRTHIYLRDLQGGTTQRVNIAADGAMADNYTWEPSVSSDGRYVAFYSNATNLVPNDTGGWSDVFVRDRGNAQTHRVSVSSTGIAGNGDSVQPMLGANGRYVVFVSLADNLVANDTNGRIDVFVHDLQQRTTDRVSVASDGRQANGSSYEPSISADGRYVTFESFATNLVAGDTNRRHDVFVHDRETRRTWRASVDSDGRQANDANWTPSISADGRVVAFRSDASNLVANDFNTSSDVYVHLLADPGADDARFTLKPDALDFGAQPVSSSHTEAFWLRNKGATALELQRIELRGADARSFSSDHTCGTSVAAGAVCRISVTFEPHSVGAKAATLKVFVDDGVVRTRELRGEATP
jgi:Tol biopolymer transport system component